MVKTQGNFRRGKSKDYESGSKDQNVGAGVAGRWNSRKSQERRFEKHWGPFGFLRAVLGCLLWHSQNKIV